jgi:hypothetical protein
LMLDYWAFFVIYDSVAIKTLAIHKWCIMLCVTLLDYKLILSCMFIERNNKELLNYNKEHGTSL